MSEISLICPGCDAEYRLPEAAIPPAGREVECSACGRVWMAHGHQGHGPRDQRPAMPRPAAPPAAPPLPPPSNRLPANVLDILKEEAARERLLRAAENAAGDGPQTGRSAPPAPPEDEADWPATTVILPAASLPGGSARAIIAAPQPQPPLLQPPVPAPDPAPEQAPETPQVIRHPVTSSTSPDGPPPPAPAAPPARNGSYRTGFGLAVMLAACFVALYLLAPGLSDSDHPLGQQLMDLRHEVDRARLWLQDQARALTG